MPTADIIQIVIAFITAASAAAAAIATRHARRSAEASELALELSQQACVVCLPAAQKLKIRWDTRQESADSIEITRSISNLRIKIVNAGLGVCRDTQIEICIKKQETPKIWFGRREQIVGRYLQGYIGGVASVNDLHNAGGENMVLRSSYNTYDPAFRAPVKWSEIVPAPVDFGLPNQKSYIDLPACLINMLSYLAMYKSPCNQEASKETLSLLAEPIAEVSVKASWIGANGRRVYGNDFKFFLMHEETTGTDFDGNPIEPRGADWLNRMSSMVEREDRIPQFSAAEWVSMQQEFRLDSNGQNLQPS